jgi:serine/threonine-protein kinase
MTEFEQKLRETLSNAYEIERELGGGGMSRVFVATDRVLGRKIVIKLLSPELIADVNRGRFRREIQVAAQLQHPHIVPLLSAGEHEDLVYYTMPFIAGESLKQSVEKNGPMQITDVVRVLYHVGEALDYAHGEGVVHRDIKPANILRSGTYALVTDFGVAKALNAAMPSSGMTSTGMAIGTPAYMAPEQLAGDPNADHRIDIYALGLLAYELLNGRSPYAATTPQKVLAAVLTQDAPPLIDVRPDVPRSLSEIVMSCLAKEPDDRPATARALLNALDTFSTASGEIRTQEHKVPRVKTPPVVPTPLTPTPAHAQPAVVEPTPVELGEADGYETPKKSGKTKLIGWVVLGLALVAGAIFWRSTRSGESSNGATPPNAAAVAESASLQPTPVAVAPLPGATTDSIATAAPKLDSAALADSIKKAAAAKKAAAKADSVKKAAARADSLQRAQNAIRGRARSAAIGLLADANARQAFTDGATHMGGVLGKKRMGDLQTQINALQPFLTRAGLTYDQFKAVALESGIKLFDEFGRMVPDSLRRFTGVSH